MAINFAPMGEQRYWPTFGIRHDSESECSDLLLVPQDWFNSLGGDECEPGTTGTTGTT